MDGHEATEHQKEGHEDREVHRDPDLALGDHSRRRLGIIRPCRPRVDEVPDQPEDGARNGRNPSDPEHPSLVVRFLKHDPHLWLDGPAAFGCLPQSVNELLRQDASTTARVRLRRTRRRVQKHSSGGRSGCLSEFNCKVMLDARQAVWWNPRYSTNERTSYRRVGAQQLIWRMLLQIELGRNSSRRVGWPVRQPPWTLFP